MASTHVSLSYHIVFSTRNREPFLIGERRTRMHEMLGGCRRTAGGVALEIGGTADHVHLMAGLKVTHRVADVVRDIKRATSSWFESAFRMTSFAWQEGYGAFTVSPNDCAGLTQYVRTQEEHHRKRPFQDEYRELLRQHGIEFDERYLW